MLLQVNVTAKTAIQYGPLRQYKLLVLRIPGNNRQVTLSNTIVICILSIILSLTRILFPSVAKLEDTEGRELVTHVRKMSECPGVGIRELILHRNARKQSHY